jgi:hypothetical protein
MQEFIPRNRSPEIAQMHNLKDAENKKKQSDSLMDSFRQ